MYKHTHTRTCTHTHTLICTPTYYTHMCVNRSNFNNSNPQLFTMGSAI